MTVYRYDWDMKLKWEYDGDDDRPSEKRAFDHPCMDQGIGAADAKAIRSLAFVSREGV